ncbi:MAG: porin family protein [Gammaproteobacteria bacterium]|nr:porin family protein [Gammaproteobacteria bacterium]
MKNALTKRSLLALSAIGITLAMSSPAIAGGPDRYPANNYSSKGSFYVGAEGGRDATDMKFRETSVAADAVIRVFNGESLQGWLGGVFAGYQWNLSPKFYLNTEGFFDWNSSMFTYSNPSDGGNATYYTYRKQYTGGINLMPGMRLNNNDSLYALGGWVISKFKRVADSNINADFGNDFNNADNGYDAGFGFLTYLSDHVGLRLQYRHSGYGTISNTNSAATNNSYYTPTSDDYTIGLLYQMHKTPYHQPHYDLLSKNIYIGLRASRDMTQVKQHVLDTDDDESWPHLADGYSGGVALGYSRILYQHFYYALEGFYNLSSAVFDFQHQTVARNYQIREKYNYGLSFLPGYNFNASSVVFMRLGWIAAKFEKNGGVAAGGNVGPNFKETENGFETGVGFETAICKNTSIVGEYDYATYNDIKNTSGSTEFKYYPSSNLFTLGLNVRFS